MNYPIIDVKSYPRYEPARSQADKGRYFYSYQICIRNLEGDSCQLISRCWLITDANGVKQQVVGEGVVGQQPTLQVGDEFTYTSGCMLDTPVGTMEGYYIMRTCDGREFHAPIEPFLLAVPGTIN